MEMIQDESRQAVLRRLRRIEGQVRGLQKMIEEQKDCREILTQVAAVKSAVTQVGLIVFENHAQQCIAKAIHENSDDTFRDIVDMMGKLMK
ncbi:MAG TPA: metal-sensitive transcriptional regulator [Syntrophomonadaceae bacterium]|jgi:DNA-binding FrmR family transcriptional regulator|nr:metal-sensitive transcriptional regulator [Syntrophomonadaceae bacterium]HRX21444.1 metal-sensitive transcriptional regulator [Syntrophomonadaceae bacterium]